MKNMKYVLFLLALLVFASPIFAQTPATVTRRRTNWVADHVGLLDGHRVGPLRPRTGQGHRRRG